MSHSLRPQPPTTNEFSSKAPRFWNFEVLGVEGGSLYLCVCPFVWGTGPHQHFLNKSSPYCSVTVRLGAINNWQFVAVIMTLETFQMAFPFLSRRTKTYTYSLWWGFNQADIGHDPWPIVVTRLCWLIFGLGTGLCLVFPRTDSHAYQSFGFLIKGQGFGRVGIGYIRMEGLEVWGCCKYTFEGKRKKEMSKWIFEITKPVVKGTGSRKMRAFSFLWSCLCTAHRLGT